MVRRLLIFSSVGLNVAVLALAIWLVQGGFGSLLRTYFLEPNRERQLTQWDAYPVEAGNVVFLGDSITAGGEWAAFFPQLVVRNLGVGGDTTQDVLDRLHQVTGPQPARIFLKIGTNDLGFGATPEEIEPRYAEILDRIASESPGTLVYVQSVLPRDASYQPHVVALNERIRKLAEARALPYVDLYPAFVCEDGSICDEYANDELHLLGAGYAKWVELLRPHVFGTDW